MSKKTKAMKLKAKAIKPKRRRIMNYNGDRLAWFGGLGDDCVPGYFAIGCQAYTSSISNIAPQLSLALRRAARGKPSKREHPRGKYRSNPIFSNKQLNDFLLSTVADQLLMSFFRHSGLRSALIEHLTKNPPDKTEPST